MMPRLRRGVVAAIIAALGLAGCVGQIASSVRAKAQQMWVPCPGYQALAPSWSADNTMLAFLLVEQNTGFASLHTADLSASRTTRVADLPGFAIGVPEWSPDGQRILLAYDDGSQRNQVAYFTLEGELVPFPEQGSHVPFARWSPSGEHIAIMQVASLYSDLGTARELIVLTDEGDTVWKLSDAYPDTFFASAMCWSPDGSQLALALSQESVAVVSIQGGGVKVLFTAQRRADVVRSVHLVEWSPDGSRIAFTVQDPFRDDLLYTIRPDGSDLREMAHIEQISSFRWLADSSGLIFITANGGVATISADGTAQSVLMARPANSVGHIFSPDATMVAYQVSGRYGFYDLVVSRVDGSDTREIYSNPGNRSCFQWPF